MKLSDKIANCTKCRQMTEAFSTDRDELFQVAWLKIREKEIKGKSFDNVKDHKGYFYLILRNVFFDMKRKERVRSKVSKLAPDVKAKEEDPPQSDPCPADLLIWMYEETKDEDELFYKNILILRMQVPKHKDVQEQTKMDRKTYLNARKEAEKKARHDIINRIADTNNSGHPVLV